MADWQLMAKTIYCDAVDDEVTFLVSRDGTSKCTGQQKYEKPNKETSKTIKTKNKKSGRPLKCDAADCSRITEYREKLLGS